MKPKIYPFLFFFLLLACSGNKSTSPSPGETPKIVPLEVADCLVKGTNHKLDAVTWNIKQFPTDKQKSVPLVADLIRRMDADILAIQEIRSKTAFRALVDSLEGWEGKMYRETGLDLGFLYKTAEIEVLKQPFRIYPDAHSPFPREPLVVKVRHTNGLSVTFINIHLKCCNGKKNENRRRDAARLLKKYIDTNLPTENVVVLGDFNDLIVEKDSTRNVFLNFLRDKLNFRFATKAIAKGNSKNWSYPSYPSQIDHILISNELFDNLDTVKTIRFDVCDKRYKTLVSDHRPVYLSLKADQ